MAVEDVTADDMRAHAADLEDEAAMLERFAAERYDESARLYQGGSSTFVRSIDTADGYRKKARALRAEAKEYRRVADFIEETEGPRPGRGAALSGDQEGVPEWQRKLNDVLNR